MMKKLLSAAMGLALIAGAAIPAHAFSNRNYSPIIGKPLPFDWSNWAVADGRLTNKSTVSNRGWIVPLVVDDAVGASIHSVHAQMKRTATGEGTTTGQIIVTNSIGTRVSTFLPIATTCTSTSFCNEFLGNVTYPSGGTVSVFFMVGGNGGTISRVQIDQ